jgi:hypothetical protein
MFGIIYLEYNQFARSVTQSFKYKIWKNPLPNFWEKSNPTEKKEETGTKSPLIVDT